MPNLHDRTDQIHRRTWSHPGRNHRGRPILGLFILFWGVVLLARALNVPGLEDLHRWFWPTALIGGGLAALVFGQGGERAVGGLLLALDLPITANRLLGWDLHVGELIWPALLIFFGVRMLFGPRRHMGRVRVNIQTDRAWSAQADARPAGDTPGPALETAADPGAPGDDAPQAGTTDAGDAAGRIREFAFLGGIERNNTSQAFRGGDVTAALGGVELDLRECRMAPEGARLQQLL